MRSSFVSRGGVAALFCALLLPSAASCASSTSAYEGALNAMGLKTPADGSFRVEKSYVRGDWDGGGSAVPAPASSGPGLSGLRPRRRAYWTLIASRGAARFRFEAVKNVSRSEAERRARERFASVRMLYFGDAAYPGMVTKRFEVPESLRPEILPRGPGGYKTMILHATARMTYGAGARDLVAYRSLMSYRYCRKERVLIQIELFFEKADFRRDAALEELADFSCR